MNRSLWFIPVFIVLSSFISNQPEKATGAYDDGEVRIEWMTFEEAVDANAETPKLVFIDFYTDWCGWCKKMDANTFTNPLIADKMTNGFYAVKFDAEMDRVINFKGKDYGLVDSGRRKAHELAIELATHNERLGYPTFVVLDENMNKLKTFQGYKTVDALKQILDYYGDEEHYKKMNWMQFVQSGQSPAE